MDKVIDYIRSNVIWKPCSSIHRVEQSGQGFPRCMVCKSTKALSNWALIRVPFRDIRGRNWIFTEDFTERDYLGLVGRLCPQCQAYVALTYGLFLNDELQQSLMLQQHVPLLVLADLIMSYNSHHVQRCPLCL